MSEQQDTRPIIQHWSASVKELFYEHATVDASSELLPISATDEPGPPQGSWSLSEDVTVCVLAHCDLRDLVTCMAVCWWLRTLIQSDTYLLRYRILLAANGRVDGPSGHSNKLAMLQDHCSRVAGGAYSCSSGRYLPRVDMIHEKRRVALAFGGTITYVVMKAHEGLIEIYEPSPIPGNRTVNRSSVPLTLFPTEGQVYRVSADTTQDLLLVVQYLRDGKTDWDLKVHIRSLSDPSACHPRASSPILYTGTWAREFKKMDSIQIHRRYVAWVLFSDASVRGSRIELWDWQSGLIVWCCDFGSKVSFALLDSVHIVVADDHWDHLRVYRTTGHVWVTQDILRLDLPSRDCRPRVQESSIPVAPASAPFWPDPKLRVILVAYSRSLRRGIIIPFRTFGHWLDRIVLDATISSYHSLVDWKEWGPSGTALLDSPSGMRPSRMDRTYPYGSRLSFLVHDRDASQHIGVVTVEINPIGRKLARNPYIIIPPHLRRTASKEVMVWTPHVQMRNVVYSSSRGEPDPELRHPTIITHPYGYTELFHHTVGTDAPPSQQVGFRIHTVDDTTVDVNS